MVDWWCPRLRKRGIKSKATRGEESKRGREAKRMILGDIISERGEHEAGEQETEVPLL